MKTKLLFILFLTFSICCFAQKRTITGTIYDENKNVLADANVIVNNSEKGIITDEKGQFTIDANSKDTLVISYLGFETKEVVITDQKRINVILENSFDKLDIVFLRTKTIKLAPWELEVNKAKSTSSHKLTCHAIGVKILYLAAAENVIPTLFPNPSTNGIFQLQLNKNVTKLTVEVYNMNGQLLQSNTHTQLSKNPEIDLSKHPKGIYLIRIVADGKVLETKKAIRS